MINEIHIYNLYKILTNMLLFVCQFSWTFHSICVHDEPCSWTFFLLTMNHVLDFNGCTTRSRPHLLVNNLNLCTSIYVSHAKIDAFSLLEYGVHSWLAGHMRHDYPFPTLFALSSTAHCIFLNKFGENCVLSQILW